jgi:hypothetical protein
VLLTTFGAVLLVVGISQRLQVSAGIGAFLIGIAVSGAMAQQTHRLLAPLRDLFAATFFFFFGLQINPATLPPVLLSAVLLGGATRVTKVLTGDWAARRSGVDQPGRLRAGMALVARGEFSIVIAPWVPASSRNLDRCQLPTCSFWQSSVPFSCAPVSNESCKSVLPYLILLAPRPSIVRSSWSHSDRRSFPATATLSKLPNRSASK